MAAATLQISQSPRPRRYKNNINITYQNIYTYECGSSPTLWSDTIRPQQRFLPPDEPTQQIIFDLSNMAMHKRPTTFRRDTAKAGVETSPFRRKALKGFFDACDFAHGVNPCYACAACSHSFELWDTSGCARIGRYD